MTKKERIKAPLSDHPFSLANTVKVIARRVQSALDWIQVVSIDALRLHVQAGYRLSLPACGQSRLSA
jgi:hypothetical protein